MYMFLYSNLVYLLFFFFLFFLIYIQHYPKPFYLKYYKLSVHYTGNLLVYYKSWIPKLVDAYNGATCTFIEAYITFILNKILHKCRVLWTNNVKGQVSIFFLGEIVSKSFNLFKWHNSSSLLCHMPCYSLAQ